MFHNRPPVTPDPGGTAALGMENLTQCMNGGATSQLSNSYSFLPGLCHQNGYSLFPVQQQQIFLNEVVGNPHVLNIQSQIRALILRYIKQCLGCSMWKGADIIKLVDFLDGKLLAEATSMENYLDLSTVFPRLDHLISYYANCSSAIQPQPVPNGIAMPGTATPLIETYGAPLSSSTGGTLPDLYGAADYLSDANGSCLQTVNGADITNFSTLEDCGSTMLLDSFGSYGHPNSQTLSTLDSNGLGNFQERNPTSQLLHQAAYQPGHLNSQALSTLDSNRLGNFPVPNPTSQPLHQKIQVQCSPCVQITPPGNHLFGNSESFVAGHDSSHSSGRFENPEKSLECNIKRTSSCSKKRAATFISCSAAATSTLDYQDVPPKRLKLDPPWTCQLDHRENCSMPHMINSDSLTSPASQEINGDDSLLICTKAVPEFEPMPHVMNSGSLTSPASQEINGDDNLLHSTKETPEFEPGHYPASSQGSSETISDKSELSGAPKKMHVDGLHSTSVEKGEQFCEDQVQLKAVKNTLDSRPAEAVEVKKLKLKGVSLIEWFTADQLRELLKSSRHLRDGGTINSEKCRDVQYPVDENICQICGLANLCFDPPAIYCSACLNRIGRSRAYYIVSREALSSAGQNYFCNTCYKGNHGGNIQYGKFSIAKSLLEKKKNDDRVPEPWVQCDKCSSWQHQICTLFNHKQNEGERAEYFCPSCYLEEMKTGERLPLSPVTLLGAKDLPKSKLSEHIEKQLFARLRQEREERAKLSGKHLSEVPEAKDLVLRVVSSIDKKLEVQKPFLEIFGERNHPAEFSYKSKAVLLFQNIEGADVCLFGMYVQEYGSNCPCPNQRHIYLSYIDSVKYFQPDIKAVSGEALRTFVYQEILIAYLEYAKMRGFASCYIWVCPATKREDFIFNCHPEKQKMPKKDKLREWYFAMFEKAAKQDVVVHKTNLYDRFFVPSSECKASITAARLPYFDGDYWPGVAEKVLDNLREQEEGKESHKKGKIGISRRAFKAVRHSTSTQNPKDILLMNKLEELILPKKEDFIMLQLQHTCDRCCQLIMCGKRWVCNICKKFQLCDKCHVLEGELDVKDRHPIDDAEKHSFQPFDVADIPEDTVDEDDNMQSEIFDSRIAFLDLCQREHYQYDSLRHAKYSTMMILYHLHNATQRTSVESCAHCHCDVKAGHCWHCGECPQYNLCDSCYTTEGKNHRHQLTSHATDAARVKEENGRSGCRRISSVKDLLDTLEHSTSCFSRTCSYPTCRRLKALFHHATECRIRLNGGCNKCNMVWYILRQHARTCNDPACRMPRCVDLRKHCTRSELVESQSDSCLRRAGTLQSSKGGACGLGS